MDFSPSAPPISPATRASGWLAHFGEWAQLDPGRTAVICGGATTSYGTLLAQADHFAQRLRHDGIGPGTQVGLGLRRSLGLPAALLGIIKSGATYVPLDPTYPAARILQMVASAKLETVVTTSDCTTSFPGVRTICWDGGVAKSSAIADPPFAPASDDLIYAIFTSGSTGAPKAAAVRHRGFANLLDWYIAELGLTAADRTLVTSSPSFDLTQKNFYAPLATGGTLILDEAEAFDITRITALIRDHGVTVLNCTPSAFYPIIEAAAAHGYAALSTLRFAVLGGEAISIPRLRGWLEHPSCHAEVMNTYGPTECTDICLFHRLNRGNLDQFPFVPLGREIPHVQVTIRDESLAPVSPGEIGELCISGAGVGAGYLHDAERTAAAFVDSFYRTGDLARRLADGTVEFRGRADQQVKVNGHRIELGEIEAALQIHPQVRGAIVTAQKDRLVAHFQGNADAASLRTHLSATLPAYMVPGEFRRLETFPLTPNGKVDRLALVAAPTDLPIGKSTGGTIEHQVLALWAEILGMPVTDAAANFFDLGGTSIHLAVVHVRLMEMTGRAFPITRLFALPTARAIAEFLDPSVAKSEVTPVARRAQQAHSAFSRFRTAPSR